MPDVKGYSLKEVAAEVERSTSTIIRWIDTGKVDITKKKNSQGHYVFTEADLKKLKTHKNSISTSLK